MAVAFDASSESAEFTTTSPATFTHTPVGTPAGVVVGVVQADDPNAFVTGVTYGGTAMELVGVAEDTSGEESVVNLYFLGAGIPAGAQTVSIAHTGTASQKWAAALSVTAATDTEIGSGQALNENAANPGRRTSSKYEQMVVGILFRGGATPTPGTGVTSTQTHDFVTGGMSGTFAYQTTPAVGVFSMAFTQSDNNNAFALVGVQEAVAGIHARGAATSGVQSATSFVLGLNGPLVDVDLYCFAVSRDHTSGTALPTCTDDSGANTWDLLGNSAQRQYLVWHKKATAADMGAIVTVAGTVGSTCGGVVYVVGGDAGDPTTNLVFEDNISGDETHAGFTPDEPDSLVVFGVGNVANDNAVTTMAAATLGTFEPEVFEIDSTAGSDCATIAGAVPSPGGPNATGDFTWAQTNGVTASVTFAVRPATAGFTGTGASTLDGVTSAGSGTFTPAAITGTGASTLDGVTSAGSGTFTPAPITGTGASTLQGVTSAGSGTFIAAITGTGSATLQGVTSVGTGVYTPGAITGTGASTLDGVTSEGDGFYIDPITGTGNSTLDGVTSVGVGVFSVAGEIGDVVCTVEPVMGVDCSVGSVLAVTCQVTQPFDVECRVGL
jgi:hypothetical protein